MVAQETKRKSDVNKILDSSLFLSNLWNDPEQLEDPKELKEFLQLKECILNENTTFTDLVLLAQNH